MKMAWSFQKIWNESLKQRDEWEIKSRDNIWASELGSPFIDRWYKMRGYEPSNPFDFRSLRKFEAGKLFEWIVEVVLQRAGILRATQEYIRVQIPGYLPVTGKLDQLAGGKPNWEMVKQEMRFNNLPPLVLRTANAVVEYFSKKYPHGLKEIILEVKSVGSFLFHRYDVFKMADPKHSLQLYHYLRGKNMPEGHLVYISKDDLCMTEVGIMNNSVLGNLYENDIKQMTEYFKSDSPPPKELPIIFDEIDGKFHANWKVAYSLYLTKIYGLKNQNVFDSLYKSTVARWNRVLGRVLDKKNLTAKNEDAIREIKTDFPNFDELIEIAEKKRAIKKRYGEDLEKGGETKI